MSKIITFSRIFPAYHSKKRQKTFFVEKVLNSLGIEYRDNPDYLRTLEELNQKNLSDGKVRKVDLQHFTYSLKADVTALKPHTIRGGNKTQQGELRSPRYWSNIVNKISGRKGPYHSPQIIFAPDIEIKKIWSFEMDLNGVYSINGKYILSEEDDDIEILLAKNDGFEDPADMFNWFMPNYDKPKEFKGQIICWNENIKY